MLFWKRWLLIKAKVSSFLAFSSPISPHKPQPIARGSGPGSLQNCCHQTTIWFWIGWVDVVSFIIYGPSLNLKCFLKRFSMWIQRMLGGQSKLEELWPNCLSVFSRILINSRKIELLLRINWKLILSVELSMKLMKEISKENSKEICFQLSRNWGYSNCRNIFCYFFCQHSKGVLYFTNSAKKQFQVGLWTNRVGRGWELLLNILVISCINLLTALNTE